MLLLIGLLAFALFLGYKFWTSAYLYWERKGVPHIPGSFPFGSDSRLTRMTTFQGHIQNEMYKRFSPLPYFGLYRMRIPFLLVRDPEIINVILIKQFSHFTCRHPMDVHEKDILSHHLAHLDGELWKALRNKLTPTFTSGKLKSMFPLFVKCAENLQSLRLTKCESAIDVKETMSCFTLDVISSCAFGLDTNAISNPNNDIKTMGMKAFKMKRKLKVKFFLLNIVPQMARLLRMRFFEEEVENFFVKLVADTVQYREKNNIKRNDFLDLLIQLKNKGSIAENVNNEREELCTSQPFEMTTELMVAQCFVFFVAGYDTSSSVQTFCLYELAINPDIQKKVQNEIDNAVKKHGEITYDAINEMIYLKMVLSETLRKYPVVALLERTCTKELVLPDGYKFEKGERVMIPVWSLHHDSTYFPNPEKFDPERFSAENKVTIKPNTYMPFGDGPRACIGQRFGLLQVKVGLVTILRKYTVEPTNDTEIPLEFKGLSFITTAKKSISLNLLRRF